jgi:hypothetical protein
MVWFRRLCMAVGVTAALTVVAAPASAQTYALAGVEIEATSTQGTFVGFALAPDDYGTWGAVIGHTGFDSFGDATIIGGYFAIDGQVRDLEGTIRTGGTIESRSGFCRKETFEVTGQVDVYGGGTGDFNVTLTHYGFRVPWGGCFTYFATVEGGIGFPTLEP